MFGRIASALYSAVDVLAPPIPLQEEFIWHWEAAANFYTDKRSCSKTSIEATSIPLHLRQLLSLIDQERNESDSENVGLCMEYMLQHKILDTMCVLARADTPPGMKKHILIFVTQLLDHTKYSLLPHVNVYSTVQKLINLCGETLAAPFEKEEVSFLQVVCKKLSVNPHLLDCFVTDPLDNKSHVGDSKRTANQASFRLSPFPLVKSLLTLLQSQDSEVSDTAAECLATCVSLANEKIANIILTSTNLPNQIVANLGNIYHTIPKSLTPTEMDRSMSLCTSEMHFSQGRRRVMYFLKWVDFINELASIAHESIANALCETVRETFLEKVLYSELSSTEQEVAILATTVASACIRHLTFSPLANMVGKFLIGDVKEVEIPGVSNNILKELLIERCHNSKESSELSMASLQLFEELLLRPSEDVINSLVMCNLLTRGYYDHTAGEDYFSLSDDEDDEFSLRASHQLRRASDVSPGSSPVSHAFAPSHISKILNCFLFLLPDEIKSCSSEEDSGYDVYIKDANRQFQECLFICENWNWPTEPVRDEFCSSEEDSGTDSQPEAEACRKFFYEGSFLSMIFDKLESMLEQPYEVNLQVTSLVTKLALLPHPNLHEFLLNPLIPIAPNSRTLFMVLLKVVEDIQIAILEVPGFKKKLKIMRKTLLSEDSDIVESHFGEAGILEAVIVMEEFCKELAAVTFVKYHASA